MILQVHSDSLYLSLFKGHSRAGGYYVLSDYSLYSNKVKKNGTIHVLCNILKNIMGSAAKTEIAALHDNAKEVLPIQNTLKFLNCSQPSTPIQVGNTMAARFANR